MKLRKPDYNYLITGKTTRMLPLPDLISKVFISGLQGF